MAAALEGRSRLLVFDNCEHVLDAAADMVEAILARSATVKIWPPAGKAAGGRRALWPVPRWTSLAASTLPRDLFLARATSCRARYLASRADGGRGVEICRRLDGIPLAIELAASRMQSMTVTELRDRLDDRFRLLVGSRRGLERHQTLRHAVAWSHDLLDDTEKTLLARCSVFAGGFDLAAACAVGWLRRRLGHPGCARCAGAQVPSGRRPIIGADPVFDAGDHPPVRRGATRRLAERRLRRVPPCSPLRRARSRHPGPVGQPPPTRGVRLVHRRVANLRTAFRWAADHGDLDAAATIATYATFLGIWSKIIEPIAWAEELIEPARAVDHPRLAALYVMATQCWMVGRIEAARRLQRRRLGSCHQPGATRYRSAWRAGSAACTWPSGQPERSVEWFRAQLARGPAPVRIDPGRSGPRH